MWPRYIKCRDCHGHWRIELLTPTVGSAPATHCPGCGTQAVFTIDRDQDYWYILAEGYNLKADARGVALLKGLYDLWNPAEEDNLGTFIQKTLKEFKNG